MHQQIEKIPSSARSASRVSFREITFNDLEAILELLCEGFPRRTSQYWQEALARLTERPLVAGFPRYGYLLEAEGQPQGVLLLLTAVVDSTVRSNLSSWYVRQPYRGFATQLVQLATRTRGATYLDLTPAPKVLPIVKALGFKPYSNGTLLFTPRLLLSGNAGARIVGPCNEDDCDGFILEDREGRMQALYRIKTLKRLVPAARFVFGDPKRLCAAGVAVARALLKRGIPLAMVDAPLGFEPPPGIVLMPEREIRYSKHGEPPAVGDLRESEIALFGP